MRPDGAHFGVVQSHAGTSPGPRGAFTYTVRVNFPDGAQVVEGIRPVSDGFPDTLDSVALKPGTGVFVASVRGVLQLMPPGFEVPSFGPCPGSSPGTGARTFSDLDLITAAYLAADGAARARFRKAVGL